MAERQATAWRVTGRTILQHSLTFVGELTQMPLDIGIYSYLIVVLGFGALTVLLLLAWKREQQFSLPVLVASALTTLWGAAIAVGWLMEYPPVVFMQLTEVARNAAWIFLLLNLLSQRMAQTDSWLGSGRWRPTFFVTILAVLVVLFVGRYLEINAPALAVSYQDIVFAAWLGMAVIGLLLLEQVFRNASAGERWSSKYLCLGLGLIFAYDFFMYAEALLFRQLDSVLWQARGIVVSLAVPMLTVAIARNTNWADIHVSRHVVFHSVTLMAAGLYLIMMAIVGYFIRYIGADWGGVAQVTFLVAAALLLLVLLFSGSIRAKLRVWLSKNFFSYRYDYREEWLRFTETLSQSERDVPERVIASIAALVSSKSGLLWMTSEENNFRLAAHWQMPEPAQAVDLGNLPDWLTETQWIIDLEEWERSPDLYDGLQIPAWIAAAERHWLLVPLLLSEQLQGILLLSHSDLHPDLNWEDRDLLKLAGRQAASQLAQYRANLALVEARQFEAFNRLSAYVIHDLKNILAQQSLIISNAEKHKHNPAFVDDVIGTVRNSVDRMQRLMEQMRTGVRGSAAQTVSLPDLLMNCVDARSGGSPAPTLVGDLPDCLIEADREQLGTVFGHLLQNAQEATEKDGTITVELAVSDGRASVKITDTGCGMDDSFIRHRLFKPFDSTKGLTGMGIGAFESREFVRSLGGDITVNSDPGVGSTFRVVLPCQASKEVEVTSG